MFPSPSHYSSLQDRLHSNHSIPMLAPAPVTEPRAAVYWCCLGAGPGLQLLASLLLPAILPPAVTSCQLRRGKWAATFIARINAAITGIWAVTALQESAVLRADLLRGCSATATCCLLFSLGVHAAETLDMVCRGHYTLLTLHHIGTILTIAGVLNTNIGQGFGMFCLVPELNAVFNKTRLLHLLEGVDKTSLQFRVNSGVNIATFLARVLITTYVQAHSFQHFLRTPNTFFLVTLLSISFINFWNMSCFKTLVVKDLLRKPKTV